MARKSNRKSVKKQSNNYNNTESEIVNESDSPSLNQRIYPKTLREFIIYYTDYVLQVKKNSYINTKSEIVNELCNYLLNEKLNELGLIDYLLFYNNDISENNIISKRN